MICVGVFNLSIYTAYFSIARIISASIIIITDDRSGDTTSFKVTRIGITLIVVNTTISIFSNYTAFFRIAVRLVTFIRGSALR
jgi:hypothetical protein